MRKIKDKKKGIKKKLEKIGKEKYSSRARF